MNLPISRASFVGSPWRIFSAPAPDWWQYNRSGEHRGKMTSNIGFPPRGHKTCTEDRARAGDASVILWRNRSVRRTATSERPQRSKHTVCVYYMARQKVPNDIFYCLPRVPVGRCEEVCPDEALWKYVSLPPGARNTDNNVYYHEYKFVYSCSVIKECGNSKLYYDMH